MPLAFLAVVGFVLVVLLVSAGATLEKITLASIQTPVAAAPAAHVTRAAQPRTQVAPEDPVRIEPAARAARAEAPPKTKRVIREQRPAEHPQLFDRFSIKGY